MKYEFENLWISQSGQSRQDIIDFWDANKLLKPGVKGEDRVKEAVLAVRNELGKVIGVSTAFKAHFKQLNNNFYVFRCAIAADSRAPGLMSKILVETRDFLESIYKNDAEPCVGLLAVIENPIINKNRREAVWPASKMVYMGATPDGKQIRVYYFKGVRI